jgi:hypothetical protein
MGKLNLESEFDFDHTTCPAKLNLLIKTQKLTILAKVGVVCSDQCKN